ncbi:class I SAM-dependent methyltransferase [Lysobacter sp. TY2-98]|uniref:SAM-dependent methyltransferase n=1 Tax=Lysobacter sp. TY2-98 TaxID=2290922 RepID=UPI000E20758E|nr:cyclopropane-fatty-acyl-phospholipid synthase family protein [Lysobacter sp. TY2-98]AXK71176.1 class I SAM-dependent methyltransferase [Lysobacter sp. TY2-98]
MNTVMDAVSDRPDDGLLGLAERGVLPDPLIRIGIRRLCEQRLRDELRGSLEAQSQRMSERLDGLRASPLALHTEEANRQHYELPASFFAACLGARRKYSCCYYPTGTETVDEAEEAMLLLYAERAGLVDGQDILELGCGWGSLTLWMAERFPAARITAVSNSHGQREYILEQCAIRGFDNVQVITRDVNRLDLEASAYDRCVSVEMFEHMRNYDLLLSRIATWLRPGGQLFVHVFCHRTLLYPFETDGQDDWMGRHFFTGGLMPAADTLLHFQQHLRLERRWLVDGRHYERTANHWLANHDARRDPVMACLREAYGDAAPLWNQRWRIFWMACAELFGYRGGQEWHVAHYRFSRGA